MLFCPGHECNTNLSVSADVYLLQQNILRAVTVAAARDQGHCILKKRQQLCRQTIIRTIQQSIDC